MQRIKQKTIQPHLHGILAVLIPFALKAMYDGREYDEPPGKCPRCSKENWRRHEWLKHTFCRILTPEGIVDIDTKLKMWKCKECGKNVTSKGPFTYPKCNYADPIVDLALGLQSVIPAANAREKFLMNIGIQLDKDTILNYERLFGERAKQKAAISRIEGKAIGINLLKLLFGVSTAGELKEQMGIGPIASVSDETYPRVKGSKKKQRKLEYEAKREGKKAPKYPDSFTLAMSYLPELKAFSSLICTTSAFNSFLAKILFEVIKDCDLNLTDGAQAYNVFKKRIGCLVHRFRNKMKRDPELKRMKTEKLPAVDISEYLKKEFQKFLEEELKDLITEFPEFVSEPAGPSPAPPTSASDDGSPSDPKPLFTGPTSTNAIEGGNWRIKEATRPGVERVDTMESRAILACIHDSIKTFSNGHPIDNPILPHLVFSFQSVMGFQFDEARLANDIRGCYDQSGKYLYYNGLGEMLGLA